MRVSSVLAAAIAFVAGAAAFASAASPQCSVGVKLKMPKRVKAGRQFSASASIKNTGVTTLDGLYFRFQLPDFLLPLAARAPGAKRGSPPVMDGRYVYFPALRLPPRKALRLSITAGVPTCQAAGTVQLQGLAYQLDQDSDIVCTTTTAPATATVVVKPAAIKAKHAIHGDCEPPPPPGQGYSLLGENTRCLEAEPLDPIPIRVLTAAEEAYGRQLLPGASPEELQCWTCCGTHLEATEPYYFNLDADGQCYCCAECDPLYAPAYTAYVTGGRPEWQSIPSSSSTGKYLAITGSADGSLLLAGTPQGVWRSVDGGAWGLLPDTNLGGFFYAMRCNDAGTVCLAAPGALYRSMDKGSTWNQVESEPSGGYFTTVWGNPAGTVWFAATFRAGAGTNGWLYKSTDSGATWTQIPGTQIERWGTISCDATATKCVAGGRDRPNAEAGQLYFSNDGLQTLTPASGLPRGLFAGSIMSADGQNVLVTAFEVDSDVDPFPDGPGYIYRSEDGGQTFGQADVPQAYYYGIDCDSAFKMCAVAPNGDFNYDFVPMLTSCDGGRTWFDSPGVELGFLDVKVNADGGMMYSASDSRPTPTSPYYVWSFPLAA